MRLFKDFIRFVLLTSTALVYFISFQSETTLNLTELRPQVAEFVVVDLIMVLFVPPLVLPPCWHSVHRGINHPSKTPPPSFLPSPHPPHPPF